MTGVNMLRQSLAAVAFRVQVVAQPVDRLEQASEQAGIQVHPAPPITRRGLKSRGFPRSCRT